MQVNIKERCSLWQHLKMRVVAKTPVKLYKCTKTVLHLWNSLLQHVYGHTSFYHSSYLVEFWRDYATLLLLLLHCGLFVWLCPLCGKHPSSSGLVLAHVKRAVSGLQEVWDVNRAGNELQTTLGIDRVIKRLVEGFPVIHSYTHDKQKHIICYITSRSRLLDYKTWQNQLIHLIHFNLQAYTGWAILDINTMFPNPDLVSFHYVLLGGVGWVVTAASHGRTEARISNHENRWG